MKGKSDFSLFKFVAGYPETFDPHYGVKEIEGDGDIFKSENIDAFQTYVYKCTMNNGVHIMMADGVSSFEMNRVFYCLFRDFRLKDKKIFKKFSVNNCIYANFSRLCPFFDQVRQRFG